jgi:hypothetical protein
MTAEPPPFDLEVCRRLPLADAALRVLDFALDANFLAGVFEHHRGPSYEKEITFATFVHLMRDALLGHSGSAHQTFARAQQDGLLGTSDQAMYAKLRRVPIALSVGFFSETSQRLQQLCPSVADEHLPKSLRAFQPLACDGKKIKYIVKRLKVLRGLKGNVFGGKLLAIQDLATGQCLALEAVADGEAGDNPLLQGAVQQLRQVASSRPRLWVADRAFCDHQTLRLCSQDQDHFVIRYNARCRFSPNAEKPRREGIDSDGRPYYEEWGWLGSDQNRREVRLITVLRGALDPLKIVTSLLDADSYPATDVLLLYRQRWGLETMFQDVVQTFDLRHLIGSTAQASVFQAVFCLLLYNITRIIRDYVALGAQRPAKTISLDLLFQDVVAELTAWLKVLGPSQTSVVLDAVRFPTLESLRQHLQHSLSMVWQKRWTKSPTRKQAAKQPPRAYLKGGHSSVDKIQRGAHEEIPIVPNKAKAKKAKAKKTKAKKAKVA